MPDTMFIKPARPGLIVRDPVTREALPTEGREVPRSSFWIRRLTAGDVVDAAKPAGGSAQALPATVKPSADKAKAGKR